MNSTTTFDSTKLALEDLLKDIDAGILQLPDFQRGWVWDDDHIKSLLASVSEAFPIGAVMTLETSEDGIQFMPRPVEGTRPSAVDVSPETLVLDGQQRLTSLYQALFSPTPVQTKDAKGKRIERHYYFDMEAALNRENEREEAIVGVPVNRVVRSFGGGIELDLSSPEKEFEQSYFPADRLFHSSGWRMDYGDYWGHDRAKTLFFDRFERGVIDSFEKYQVPVIKLSRQTPKEAVCLVFEKVNTGGITLTVFELLTATFAAKDFRLREDWDQRERDLKAFHPVLRSLQNDDFLQAISLLATLDRRRNAERDGEEGEPRPAITCKRRDILRLNVDDYKRWADKAANGFTRAARFLHRQKFFRHQDVPYRTQLVPLSVILADLETQGESNIAQDKIARWFWCGVLGELYGGAIESRFARDVPEVIAYVAAGGGEPITIQDSSFAANRLLTLRTRNSAAYKGIYALLMKEGCLDLRTGDPVEAQTFFDDKIDIHHIFPRAWCDDHAIQRGRSDSVVNKAALSARTNRQIGGAAPSSYLATLERNERIAADRLDSFVTTHRIEPAHLRADDFDGFFDARAESLLSLVERATGKRIAREAGVFAASRPPEDYVEEPVEWEEDVVSAAEAAG